MRFPAFLPGHRERFLPTEVLVPGHRAPYADRVGSQPIKGRRAVGEAKASISGGGGKRNPKGPPPPGGEPVDALDTFGLTNLKLGEGDTHFGTSETILADAAQLGAREVRQLGATDLVWGDFKESGDALGPSQELIVPFGTSAVASMITRPAEVNKRADIVRLARRAGLRLHYTFLTTGGGGGTGDDLGAPDGREVRAPVLLSWAPEHAAAGRRGPENALAVQEAYDVSYVVAMARAMARLLVDVRNQVDPALAITDMVSAIEFGNELQTRYVVEATNGELDPEASGIAWGRLWVEVVRAFEDEFRQLGATCPSLWLPGVLSYGDFAGSSGQASTWRYGVRWFAALCGVLAAGLDGAGLPRSLVRGVDYHCYHAHGEADHPAEPRPSAALVFEVYRLRGILAEYGFGNAVAVFEDGVRGADGVPEGQGGDGPTLAGPVPSRARPDFLPYLSYTGADMGGGPREVFQAREVWRRLMTALAAGAVIQGWHTLMSDIAKQESQINAYHDFGLRVDSESGENTTVATPRLGWFAYRRLASLLGGWGGVTAARLLLPDLDLVAMEVQDEYLTAMSMALGADGDVVADAVAAPSADLLVVELRTGDGGYVYFVHVDPWRNRTWVEAVASWAASEGAAGGWELEPIALVQVDPGDAVLMTFPVWEATYVAGGSRRYRPGGFTLKQCGWDPPLLLRTTFPISWKAGRAGVELF